jgi:hypothetical protein
MIELACPSCGRAGQVPREKMNSRLVCRKCHVVFHLEAGGRAIVGEPHHGPAKDPHRNARKDEHHSVFEVLHLPTLDDLTHLGDNLSDYSFPVKPVLGVLGGLVVLWVGFSLFNGPPESVADRARLAVEALARDDLDRLKGYATDKTRDDLVRWYDAAHAKLEQSRKSWPSKATNVQVVVVEEDHKNQKGVVEAFVVPAQSGTQTASMIPTVGSKPNDKSPAATGPVPFEMHWTYSGNHWWLDGRQSLAVINHQ